MIQAVEASPVIARTQRAMKAAGLDAVIAVSPENVTYAIGTDFVMSDLFMYVEPRNTFTACLIPVDGEPTLTVWRQEFELAKQQSWVRDVRYWPMFEGTATLLAEVAREKGLERARIGVEKDYLSVSTFEQLRASLPNVTFEASEAVFAKARTVKTEYEIEQLRRVAYVTSKAISLAWERARVGDLERDVAADITNHVMRFGAHPYVFNMGSGPNSALGHRWGDDRRLQSGDIIHADAKGRIRGYWSDVSRNCVVGTPDPHQIDIYARLVAIHDRIVDMLKPGLEAREVYEFSRQVYKREGINVEPRLIGHGIGTALHEAPLLEPDVTDVLEEGMVVTVEPTHYEPGVRYHYENMVLVTARGGEVLSNHGLGPLVVVNS